MTQVKVSIDKKESDFLNEYHSLGFKDKSSLVREALEHYRKELESRKLRKSADMYSEEYAKDHDLQYLTGSAVSEWPE